MNIVTLPIKWIKLSAWCAITGYTKNAFNGKKQRGDWLENIHWKLAPDGNIFINWQEIDTWVETDRGSKYAATQSALHSASGAFAAERR